MKRQSHIPLIWARNDYLLGMWYVYSTIEEKENAILLYLFITVPTLGSSDMVGIQPWLPPRYGPGMAIHGKYTVKPDC
jgi:hypothetical protein